MTRTRLNVADLETRLKAGLAGASSPVGRRFELHDRIDSTNDRARALALEGEPEGTVVMAEEQIRGRGQADRSWHSPPGLGLYMSVLLRPTAQASRAPVAGLMAAVAGATILDTAIKWPNDLLLGEMKVAGILTEARSSEERIRDLVIGMGINVNQQRQDFPADLAASATSLRLALGHPVDRVAVAVAVLASLARWYDLWLTAGGDDRVIAEYRRRATHLEGHRVKVSASGTTWTGTTSGLSPEGALRVRRDDCEEIVVVRYGDVARVREV